ncbi:MAG: calcium/sodium antiporter [Parcubacteria group bacterium]
MLYSLIIIIIGLFAVIYGANFFVLGSASIARKLGISAFVVGLTVISIGTSAPELFINVIAASQGATDLSIGNILGSNIADVFLGLGIAAIVFPLALKKGTVWKEIPYTVLSALLILAFGASIFTSGSSFDLISRGEGIILLGLFILFLIYTFKLSKVEGDNGEDIEMYGWFRSIVYILGGVIVLVIGGKLVVDYAVKFAEVLGISQNLIGITIVAAGTSLPEIVTAVVAAKKRQIDLAVGGIVGTVIFNSLFVLGVTAVVRPLPFSQDNILDALVFTAAMLMLFVFMFTGKRLSLDKWEGIIMVIAYILYIAFAIFRG